jgi:hypothetical protein
LDVATAWRKLAPEIAKAHAADPNESPLGIFMLAAYRLILGDKVKNVRISRPLPAEAQTFELYIYNGAVYRADFTADLARLGGWIDYAWSALREISATAERDDAVIIAAIGFHAGLAPTLEADAAVERFMTSAWVVSLLDVIDRAIEAAVPYKPTGREALDLDRALAALEAR